MAESLQLFAICAAVKRAEITTDRYLKLTMKTLRNSKQIIHKTTCPLDCPDTCGILATVEDGQIVKLSGDREHPYTGGVLCAKMRHFLESRFYSRERILYPMLRCGAKGEGSFTRISWERAFAICTEKLTAIKEEFGGKAILPFFYAGNMGKINRFAGCPFFNKLGALRLKQTICSTTAGAGWAAHCGSLAGTPPETAVESDLIIAWGINIRATNMHFYRSIAEAKKRGAKLLVIDPHRSETAEKADIFLHIRPGGDIALALCTAKILFDSGREAADFLSEHTTGAEEFKHHLAGLNTEELAKEAGLSFRQIEEFASLLSSTKKTFVRIGMGLSRNSRGAMAVRAVSALCAVSGHLGGGRGAGVLLGSLAFSPDAEMLEGRTLIKEESAAVNMVQLGEALVMRKPKIRALFVYNANPIVSCPDSNMVRKGLRRDDLFTIVHEQVMTPTARYADLLLPAATFLENHDFYNAYGHFYLAVAKPVVPVLGEAKSNFDLFQELARRMGFCEDIFYESCVERIAACLRNTGGIPTGVNVEKIAEEGGLIHSSRSNTKGAADGEKIFHFVADSELLPKDQPTLPSCTSAGEAGDTALAEEYSFYLITPPNMEMLNSTFGERYRQRLGEVVINPADAAACGTHGITDGDLVRLESVRGAVIRRAVVSDAVNKGVLAASGLFWGEGAAGEENTVNNLTSQKLSDMGGGALFHESRVRVSCP